MKTATDIVRASQLRDRVIQRIFEIRHPDAMSNYREELAKYKKRLGKRQEKTTLRPIEIVPEIFWSQEVFGFQTEHMGEKVLVERPKEPNPTAWLYSGYDRSAGSVSHAREHGLLADSAYNRQIRAERVDEYRAIMAASQWHNLLSDPITLTNDGQVVNGQHRLAAASLVDWAEVENDPAFLVVWGVHPFEAYHADRSRRTASDETTIARKLGNAIRSVAGKAG